MLFLKIAIFVVVVVFFSLDYKDICSRKFVLFLPLQWVYGLDCWIKFNPKISLDKKHLTPLAIGRVKNLLAIEKVMTLSAIVRVNTMTAGKHHDIWFNIFN